MSLILPSLSFLSCKMEPIMSTSQSRCEDKQSFSSWNQEHRKGSQFSSVAQLWPTLCDPMDCSIPDFFHHHHPHQSITNSWSLLKLMSINSVMPSNHLILCHPLLLPPSIFPYIRVFSNELALRIRWPQYWSFSFSISPSSEYSGLIPFRMGKGRAFLASPSQSGTRKMRKDLPCPEGSENHHHGWTTGLWVLKKLNNRITTWLSNLTPRYILPKWKTGAQTTLCIQMFIAELFTVAKRLKKPRWMGKQNVP